MLDTQANPAPAEAVEDAEAKRLKARAKTKKLIVRCKDEPTLIGDPDVAAQFPIYGDKRFDLNVDYDAHPAYSQFVGRGDGALRQESLEKLGPVVARMMARIFDNETRERLSVDNMAQYDADTQLMIRNGATSFRADPADKRALIDLIQPYIDVVEARRAEKPPEVRSHRDSCDTIYKPEGPTEAFPLLHKILTGAGVLRTASLYMGRDIVLEEVGLMIKDHTDEDHVDVFRGLAPDPRTKYMHLDTTGDRIKAGFYLNDIGPKDGPFSYVLGSNRARMSVLERATRMANDLTGFDWTNKESARASFMSLPPHLRKKANFGNDLADGTERQQFVAERERYFTSDLGDMFLFDNRGFHRGGLVESGKRIALFMILR